MTGLRETIRRTVPFSGTAYERAQHEWRMVAGRKQANAVAESGQPIWLEIGGGARPGSGGWTTLDVTTECDIYWDLRKGIPLPDGSVERIYSSHLFEHLTYRQGQALMGECIRALAPGGSFSICVPNARLYLEAYVNGEELPSSWFGWEPANNHSTRLDMVNYIAYLDGHHRCMFDEDDLVTRLLDAGFVDVSLRAFDPEIDMADRDYESIYAEGRRR